MLNDYYCPKCTDVLTFSSSKRIHECTKCNYQESEYVLKKQQSFLNEHSINKDDFKLNEIKQLIDSTGKYKLDSFYISPSNAKKDLEVKYKYIQSLVGEISSLENHVQILKSDINNVRVLIFKELYKISYNILNEVFGAYNVKSSPKIIHDILKVTDITELSNILNNSLNDIDINSTLNYTVKPKQLTREEIKYKEKKNKELGRSFDRIGDNTFKMLTTTDINKKSEAQTELIVDGAMIAIDVGLNLVSNAFNSISNSIFNRIDSLNNVRETDKRLNDVTKSLNDSFKKLDNEIRSMNKILNINYNLLRVLEYSFLKLKQNVFSKLEKNQIYNEYKVLKEPLEKNKLFTDISSQIEKKSIYIGDNFLKFTFKSKKGIFENLWGAKVFWFFNDKTNTMISDADDFKLLQKSVSDKITSIKDIYKIKKENDSVFVELDSKVRNVLINDDVYQNVQNEVRNYVEKVFNNVKNKIE